MKRAIALVRPEPGWSATAAAARARGLEVAGHPLFAAEAVGWRVPADAADALLIGSAAAIRLGGPQLSQLAHLPVHAVGEATAAAARAAGFRVERTGAGGLQHLLDAASGTPRRFLRLGGEERVPLIPHARQEVIERAVYRMVPQAMDAGFAAALRQAAPPLVALHSAAAARHFAAEVARLGIERGRVFVVALAPRIAKDAGLGWAAMHRADAPTDAALLAMAAALCE